MVALVVIVMAPPVRARSEAHLFAEREADAEKLAGTRSCVLRADVDTAHRDGEKCGSGEGKRLGWQGG
eukprot:3510221-Pleurochrysis_carterae.AAC.1